MEVISFSLMFVFLSILSIEDIKHKKVRTMHFIYMCPIAIVVAVINVICGKIGLYEIGVGIVIVLVIAMVGKISNGLGMADIITMFMVGVISGGERLSAGIAVSLILVYGLAIIEMFRRKLNRRTTFPYIPFLNVGMTCVLLCGM